MQSSDLVDVARQAIEHATRLLKRRSNYRATFQTQHGKNVLADLKRFCRHGESPATSSPTTTTIDPIATGIRIGRQEVMQRILTQIHIDDSEITNLKEQL